MLIFPYNYNVHFIRCTVIVVDRTPHFPPELPELFVAGIQQGTGNIDAMDPPHTKFRSQ